MDSERDWSESDWTICEWYALCHNKTDRYAKHPAIGRVPVCERCATKHDITTYPIAEAVQ